MSDCSGLKKNLAQSGNQIQPRILIAINNENMRDLWIKLQIVSPFNSPSSHCTATTQPHPAPKTFSHGLHCKNKLLAEQLRVLNGSYSLLDCFVSQS